MSALRCHQCRIHLDDAPARITDVAGNDYCSIECADRADDELHAALDDALDAFADD